MIGLAASTARNESLAPGVERRGIPVVSAAVWFLALGWATLAAAAPPAVSHLIPAGGQRGTKVVVTCAGTFDPWPVSVWAPGVEVVPAAEKGKFEVTIPPDLAADRVWLRLYNSEGASALTPFLIGGLKELPEAEPNNAAPNAQAINDPSVTLNGLLEGADVDCFAVSLSAGQTLVADLDAFNDFGAPMDAVLQVAGPDGAVLAENHDHVDLDPRLAYVAKQAGKHLVRLFAFPAAPDTAISYRGGPNYVYRLTLTTGPYLSHAVPMTAPLGNPGTVEVFGWNIPPGTRLPVFPVLAGNAEQAAERETLADLRNASDARAGLVFAANFAGAAPVRLAGYHVLPTAPAPDAAEPTLLPPPAAVVGRLLRPRQVDAFRVPLKKGQQVVFAVEARSLESPVQPVLGLIDPMGTAVANIADPAPTRATLLAHAAAHDGDYRLTLRDRFRLSGEQCFYRLTARLEETDFELLAESDAVVVTQAKPAELVINVVRRAPAQAIGPISIQALDLPPGVVASTVVSETSGETAAKVTLKFTTIGPAFSGPVRIQGTAQAPAELRRFARTPMKFGACFESFWLTCIGQP